MDIYIRGLMVHKIQGSVRYDSVVSWINTLLIQQKERHVREMSLVLTHLLNNTNYFTLNNDGAILDPSSGILSSI